MAVATGNSSSLARFLFPGLAGGLFGYDIGVSSGVLVSVVDGSGWGSHLSALETGWLVSSSLLGASIPALLSLTFPRTVDTLGRREELMLAASLYLSSSLLSSQATGLSLLVGGKLLYGLGIGLAMRASPAYIAETSPKQFRGLLISMKEALIVLGIVLGYAVSQSFSSEPNGWRSDLLAAAPVAVLVLAGMALQPESPRFLLLRGREAEAMESIVRCFGLSASDKEVQEEIDAIKLTLVESSTPHDTNTPPLGRLFSDEFRRPLLIGSSLMFFQQITGQPSVLYYAAKIFADAGFTSSEAGRVSLGVGIFKFLATFVAVFSIDKLGRRPLLLTGISGMTLALLLLALDLGSEASIVGLLLFVGCYQISFGPISWLIVSEIFPLQVRSLAISFATLVNFSTNFGVSLLLPQLQEAFGLRALYLAFSLVSLLAVLSVYFTVPETKGKSLEDIQAEIMSRPI
jgi:sugar porter (SP) family MFS transporter